MVLVYYVALLGAKKYHDFEIYKFEIYKHAHMHTKNRCMCVCV